MSKTIFLLTILCSTFSGLLYGQVNLSSYEAPLPLFEGTQYLGDVSAQIEGEAVIWLERDSLIRALNPILRRDTVKAIQALPQRISLSRFPMPLRFDPASLRLSVTIPVENLARKETDLGVDLEEEARRAFSPAPVGGAINSRLEQSWGSERLDQDYFSAQFNSFVNIHSFVLENQTFYQSNIEEKWYRGDTRLVKDFEASAIRAQAGDIYPQLQGFMSARPLGGVSVQRNFTLNPYRLPYPTGHQNFTLRSRSFVRYFVNSVLVKSEYLPAGNYTARDIPLNNGLNSVLIEATDDLGQKEVFVFQSSSNINLLNTGEARFDLSYGVPFVDENFRRTYAEDEGKVFSGFYQYGFSSVFSGSLYHQNQSDFSLSGAELIRAIPIGNLTLGQAYSKDGSTDGNATALGYQLITQGERWFDSHTLLLRYERRSENFQTLNESLTGVVANHYAASYTIPVSNLFTLSVGGNYGDVRNNSLEDRLGYDLNLSMRLFQKHNLTIYASRNRDEFRRWNNVAYLFFTFSIPEANSYVSGLHDVEENSTRLSLLQDNQNQLYAPRVLATVSRSAETNSADADLTYPTPIGDLGGRFFAERDRRSGGALQGVLRYNSAFVFAVDDGVALGLSRPVPGSFVILKPEERLKGQRIGLKATSPYLEAESGLFDEIVYSNLVAYQYRDLQLDPTSLDLGRSLEQERFTLLPGYRSAHFIRLQEKGAVVLQGTLVGPGETPLSLRVGSIGEIPFFTNRDGEVFIEGLGPGVHELKIEGTDLEATIHVSRSQRGLLDLGTIRLEDSQ